MMGLALAIADGDQPIRRNSASDQFSNDRFGALQATIIWLHTPPSITERERSSRSAARPRPPAKAVYSACLRCRSTAVPLPNTLIIRCTNPRPRDDGIRLPAHGALPPGEGL